MCLLVLAPPIFPGRRQPSIVGRNELNYRVRNGNGWTLVLISTNLLVAKSASLLPAFLGKRFAALPRNYEEKKLADLLRMSTG